MKEIIIDGNKFSNEAEFYTEIDKLLTKDLDWQPGHGLDAFNDLLRGGFGVHEYGEELHITWINAAKSKTDFGYDATVKHWEQVMKICHPDNREHVRELLQSAKDHTGDTLFDIIVDIIQDSEDTGHYCTLKICD